MKSTIVVLFSTALTFSAAAEEKALTKKLPKKQAAQTKNGENKNAIDNKTTLRLEYGSTTWNTSSTKVDSANLVIRDRLSGKIVKVLLDESEPDSSIFSGDFRIDWGKVDQVVPEVYIPSKVKQSEADEAQWMRDVMKQVNENSLKRKPFIARSGENGVKTIQAFDTKEQAQAALDAYREELKIKGQVKATQGTTPSPAESLMEADEVARFKAEQAKLKREGLFREAERVRLSQIERQKALERQAKLKKLSPSEIAKNKKAAEEVAAKGLLKFNEGAFKDAAELYSQAMDLDPTNNEYGYYHAISLYRADEFNKAIVAFDSTTVAKEKEGERAYYVALAHLRLKEYDQAITKFEFIKNNDPALAPTGAFYKGTTLLEQKKYTEAKAEFEYVLDTSQDPKLDQSAEQYIERIVQIEKYAQLAKTKHFLSLLIGVQEDSNILFSSTSDIAAGTATGNGGLRYLAVGGYKYRALYEKEQEFSIKLNSVYMYSADEKFNSADPTLFTLTFPYTLKGTWREKGATTNIEPGAEVLFLDADADGSREELIDSGLVNLDTSLVMSERWIAAYKLNYRYDASKLDAAAAADDKSSANKIAFKTTQTYFVNEGKSKAVIGDFGITDTLAAGKNNNTLKIELGVSYMFPTFWATTSILNLAYYNLNYLDLTGASARTDQDIAYNLTLVKPIKDWVTALMTANYTTNDSTLDANKYDKWSVMLAASFNLNL